MKLNPPSLEIRTVAKGFQLIARQEFARPPELVFEFFGDAFKLESITPPFLKFSIVTPPPIEMREGLQIEYALRLRGIPIRWKSLISQWDPPFRFVDQQLKGPYKYWHHEHRFEAIEGGTRVLDIVDYRVPLGPILHSLIVRKDLMTIFKFRQQQLAKLLA